MTRHHNMTRLLFDVIEERLGAVGTGDRTPLLDDIVEDYRKAAGIRTRDAQLLVDRRLDTVLAMFEDDDWTPVKITSHYARHYKGHTPNHPTTDVEIARCVAGSGSGLLTFGIHFCADPNCVLFIKVRIRDMDSGEKKVGHQVRRMKIAAENGTLTLDGVEVIATQSGVSPRKDLNKVVRIAGRVGQDRLKIS